MAVGTGLSYPLETSTGILLNVPMGRAWGRQPDPRCLWAEPRSRTCLFCDCSFFLRGEGWGFPSPETIPGGCTRPSWPGAEPPAASPFGRAVGPFRVCHRDPLPVPSLFPNGYLWGGVHRRHQHSHPLLLRRGLGPPGTGGLPGDMALEAQRPPSVRRDSPFLGGSLLGSARGEGAGLGAAGRLPAAHLAP